MPKLTVLYFATLKEQRGRASEVVDVAEGTSISELYLQLFPPGPGGALPVAFARNAERVPASETLEEGDEVAFLPPLGGG